MTLGLVALTQFPLPNEFHNFNSVTHYLTSATKNHFSLFTSKSS